ncbi:MAG: helix-hairpin-helix domain-containing protein [Mycoplasmataceae bacterium]|nr:helix-hairpin-helix domain-containing protein [Mycoplasmataceae bacterium]
MNEKKDKSFEIAVPFKIGEAPKIKYSDIKTVNQLKAIGIKDSISKIIIKYKNENRGMPTWNDIDNLQGIGEKTLAFLKNHLELS